MSKYTRILSIDGGGIRGIIPGQVLVTLEEKIKNRTGNPDARIADYFDLIAGTSTGGILTCIYLFPDENNRPRPRFTAQEAVNIYLQRGGEIFKAPFFKKLQSLAGVTDEKYPSEPLERLLKDYFKDKKLSELLKPCLITAYDIEARRSRFFTQHDAKKDLDQNYFVRDAARATSAAPTFFEVAKITSLASKSYPYIDGGVFANNPTLCAYAEARTKLQRKPTPEDSSEGNPTAKDMVVLSLGTGDIKESYTYAEAKDWGKIQWVSPIINIIMTGVAETVDYQLIQVFDSIKSPEQYLRINTVIQDSDAMAEMDNVSEENLKKLKRRGEETALENSEKLDKFIDFLL
ncbi:patatin-like phospholipase family protein [Microcoleus sp. FACHB-672]|uniref:patatin-like phospholipase family protein n=1 Tax=Microcoleus sp. FACHB-672 TaxID=2692825 RepID=UPI001689EB60|nr:patatin-like phospholipase family protein [Microcoleus sp. FACHB-672]MBD2040997.1 patatin-like phospholipase family protein [Microcoleus sp. FACHB-672]